MAVDLNAVAAANRDRRRAGCDAACAGDATGRLARFGELAARSSFGTNVQPDKVLAFDDLGELVDAARIGAHRGTPPPADGFQARRWAFEDHWEHGRRFVYGAPNAGGPGAPFGPILLLLADPELPAPDALAVFPSDSAQRYTDARARLDRERAEDEATEWGCRGELAVLERGADAQAAADCDWPGVLCDETSYLEAVRAGRLPLGAVAEARLASEYRRRLAELRARAMTGEALRPEDANGVAAWDRLQGWRRRHGMAITDVAGS